MISVVCVYNKEAVLNDFLLKSLRKQTSDFQLHLVDNTKNNFKSAAEALNYGAEDARGEYIMFVHQDVDLCSETWLGDAENALDQLTNLGIAGVAGSSNNSLFVFSNIMHGDPPQPAGQEKIISPTKVQTLDECLILIPNRVFKKIKFDPVTCNDWHLYAVDYSLVISKIGLDVIVLPNYVYHRSPGHFEIMPEGYVSTLSKLVRKHTLNPLLISTTCGEWFTFLPIWLQKPARYMRRKIMFFMGE